MKFALSSGFALLLALASCGPQREPQPPADNSEAPVLPAPAVSNSEAPPVAPAPQEPSVDPKSTEAAVQLVQGFADLVNQRKFDEAYMLLGPNAPSRADFDTAWTHIDKLRVTVGTAGRQEGAAGSIYLSVPLHLSGTKGGHAIDRSVTAILRRVNDVPGSTEAQRRWHIERIDWGDAA